MWKIKYFQACSEITAAVLFSVRQAELWWRIYVYNLLLNLLNTKSVLSEILLQRQFSTVWLSCSVTSQMPRWEYEHAFSSKKFGKACLNVILMFILSLLQNLKYFWRIWKEEDKIKDKMIIANYNAFFFYLSFFSYLRIRHEPFIPWNPGK